MNQSDRNNPRKCYYCVVLALFSLLLGCSLVQPGGQAFLMLLLSTDRESYRPGEALICTVQMLNSIDREITVQNLNARSLSFWLIAVDSGETHKVEPVYSEHEDMVFPRTLEGRQAISRSFVFTRATTTSGTYTLHAMYEGVLLAKQKNLFVAPSQRVKVTIAGERVFNRDFDGILLKDDAIRIAQRALGEPADVYNVRLVKNEAGFLDWWITFLLKPLSGKEGKEVKRAFLVNPYLGAVRKEVNPLEKQEKGEEPKVMPPFKRLHPVESQSESLPEPQQPPRPKTAPKPPESQRAKTQQKRR